MNSGGEYGTIHADANIFWTIPEESVQYWYSGIMISDGSLTDTNEADG